MLKKFLRMKGLWIGFKIPFNKPKRRYKPKHDWRWRYYAASSTGARCTRCNCQLTGENREMECDG